MSQFTEVGGELNYRDDDSACALISPATALNCRENDELGL
jgi:hypothetical protein